MLLVVGVVFGYAVVLKVREGGGGCGCSGWWCPDMGGI